MVTVLPPKRASRDLGRVVAIDGPAGSGKSTVAREVARRLGWAYLDTGAMYRAVTLHLLRRRVGLDEREAVRRTLGGMRFELARNRTLRVNGATLGAALRGPSVEARVSAVSAIPEVRRALAAWQRRLAARALAEGAPGVVAEGRDMGTVVFPEARTKIFLTASLRERARRRARETSGGTEPRTRGRIETELAARDRLDATRRHAPLRPAAGAVRIDTTRHPVERVVEEIGRVIARARGSRARRGRRRR